MSKPDTPALYTIGELAERAGLTRRTVRFYVQKGVLSPPEGAGRGARYTERHLEELARIAEAKTQNMTLDHVARSLGREQSPPSPAAMGGAPPHSYLAAEAAVEAAVEVPSEGELWRRVVVAEGVELHIDDEEFTAAEREALRAALSTTIDRLRPNGLPARRRKRDE